MDTSNLYTIYKNKVNYGFADLKGIFYAFSEKQFIEGMQKIGLKENEHDKIYRLPSGGFILKSEKEQYDNFLNSIVTDLENGLNDATFCYQAFVYELQNHEFSYTHDVTDTLDCLGLTYDKLTPVQAVALQRAKIYVLQNSND